MPNQKYQYVSGDIPCLKLNESFEGIIYLVEFYFKYDAINYLDKNNQRKIVGFKMRFPSVPFLTRILETADDNSIDYIVEQLKPNLPAEQLRLFAQELKDIRDIEQELNSKMGKYRQGGCGYCCI